MRIETTFTSNRSSPYLESGFTVSESDLGLWRGARDDLERCVAGFMCAGMAVAAANSASPFPSEKNMNTGQCGHIPGLSCGHIRCVAAQGGTASQAVSV